MKESGDLANTNAILKVIKKQKLRNNEYYDTQKMFDTLFADSKAGKVFTKLYELVISPENVKLAYRNIKKNKGSKTPGVNNNTIHDMGEKNPEALIEYVENRLNDFKPHKVKRKEIPKPNGGIRPLGIPTIEDRLIQQCLLQILEPICEAKFHNHSYGFRPNRGTLHAYSRAVTLANRNGLHYVVDVDIKGFFDNVNHGKLLKQMWSMGIRDKRILSIISKLLKAEIKGIGVPDKGTPQGGVISPLLSNIVLNEFDWWISSQWETFKTNYDYNRVRIIGGKRRFDQSVKYKTLKRASKLKEMFIVRYADDFKIFCRDYKTAFIVFEAVKKWLKERLMLEISPEKSKVVNLRKNYSDFLGFKFKIVTKGKKRIVNSQMSDKAKENAKNKIKEKIKRVQRIAKISEVSKYNSTILGMHNYYKYATHITVDFKDIAFSVKRILYNRLKKGRKKKGIYSAIHQKQYGDYMKKKTIFIGGLALLPIDGVKHKNPRNFNQDLCNYTPEGREKIHQKQKAVSDSMIRYLMGNPIENQTLEYNDNRISRFIAQLGKCAITKNTLEIGNMELHHKKPKSSGGTDSYQNLIFITKDVHKLVHATVEETIMKYVKSTNVNAEQLRKINDLREEVGNRMIMM